MLGCGLDLVSPLLVEPSVLYKSLDLKLYYCCLSYHINQVSQLVPNLEHYSYRPQ